MRETIVSGSTEITKFTLIWTLISREGREITGVASGGHPDGAPEVVAGSLTVEGGRGRGLGVLLFHVQHLCMQIVG